MQLVAENNQDGRQRAERGLSTVAAVGGGAASSLTPRDLLILAFYHKRIILFAALLPLITGLVAAVYSSTEYTADNLILMLVNTEQAGVQEMGDLPSVLSIDGLKLVDSEIKILESRQTIEHALAGIDIAELYPEVVNEGWRSLFPWLSTENAVERATEKFRRDLRVVQEDSSNIVRVSFTHNNPELAALAVNRLADAYLDRRRTIFENPRSPFLATERSRFNDQLRGIESRIQTLKSEYDIIDMAQEIMLSVNQVDTIVQRRRQTQERRAALTAEVVSARTRLDALPERVFDYHETSNQSNNDDDRNVLLKLEMELDRMVPLYTPDYPPLRELERKIATVRQSMKRGDKPVYTAEREIRNPTIGFLTNHLLTLEIEQDALDRQIEELDRQHVEATTKLERLRGGETELRDLERTRSVLEQIYRDYAQRTEVARAEEESSKVRASNVRVVQDAVAPVSGQSMRLSFLLAGLIGGIMAGAGAGVVATWMRQVYILPSEIERSLGIPALASFSDGAGDLSGAGAQRELIHLAAQLLDTTVDGQPLSVIQFVCANESNGEVAVARALAIEFAQGRGLRTLLINLLDDDRSIQLLTPPADSTVGTAPAQGPAGAGEGDGSTVVLTRESLAAERLKDAPLDVASGTGGLIIRTTGIPGLSVSEAAVRSPLANLRTAVSQSRELIQELRGQFEMVVVLSPTVSVNHLARRMAPMVDVNILLARAEHTRAPVVARLRDTVLQSGGDLLGLVLTDRQFHIPQVIYRWL